MTRLNVLVTLLCVLSLSLAGSVLFTACEKKTQATAEVAVPVDVVDQSVVEAAQTPTEGQ